MKGRPKPREARARAGWRELVLVVAPDVADDAAYWLTELGAEGAWQELGVEDRGSVEIRAYAGPKVDAGAIVAEIEKLAPGWLRAPVLVRPLVERPWAEMWKKHFRPAEVADGLWIARPRARVPMERGDVCVRIEPANAFGTGLHGSTRVCLRHLRRMLGGGRGARVAKVLDVGTGSGVLAIAALHLGVPEAIGLDADVESVREARRNAARNHVERRIALVAGGPETVTGRYPLVLANLTAPTLAALADVLTARVEHGRGTLIVAGLTRSEEDDVRRLFVKRGFTAGAPLRDGDWSSFALRRAPARNEAAPSATARPKAGGARRGRR